MTYQESFATALRLKNYVRLYDKQSCIYFIFSNETEFTVTVFDTKPSDKINDKIHHEAFYIKKIPAACIYLDEGVETFSYRDPNLIVLFDLKTDHIIYFEGDESSPIDMEKVRKSFNELFGKLK